MNRLTFFLISAVFAWGTQLNAQKYKVNTEKSVLKWTASKVSGTHDGNLKIKNGTFTVENGKIIKGEFVIDMTTITNNDLGDSEWGKKLVGHLKSDDFFSVEKFPETKLIINNGSNFVNGKAKLTGDLTIKGITHPIEFTTILKKKNYQASITIDRTLYDVRYGSGKFFDNLGDNLIYDEFTIDVSLVTEN